MTPLRLFAVFVILCLATAAWVVLGAANAIRTDEAKGSLTRQVGELWGEPQVQVAPSFGWSGPKKTSGRVDIAATDIDAAFDLQPRRKGLLWYSTYGVEVSSSYRVRNPTKDPVRATMRFPFPAQGDALDGFRVSVGGKERPFVSRQGAAISDFPLGPGEEAVVAVRYATQGTDLWRYEPTAGGAGVIRDMTVTMRTNFAQVDYPVDSMSPTRVERTADGMVLSWSYESLVSGRAIALSMPKPANPGPLASRISLFAPVSLLFFFAALVLLTATSGVRLHPAHYGFLAAGFFAFDLLFSYLVDRVDINVSFIIAAVTSVVLVVGYLSVVVGRSKALVEIALSQLIFLVLFSYSFFFEGMTGLAVTIGSVLTLGYFMARTAKVDWEQVFKKARPKAAA